MRIAVVDMDHTITNQGIAGHEEGKLAEFQGLSALAPMAANVMLGLFPIRRKIVRWMQELPDDIYIIVLTARLEEFFFYTTYRTLILNQVPFNRVVFMPKETRNIVRFKVDFLASLVAEGHEIAYLLDNATEVLEEFRVRTKCKCGYTPDELLYHLAHPEPPG